MIRSIDILSAKLKSLNSAHSYILDSACVIIGNYGQLSTKDMHLELCVTNRVLVVSSFSKNGKPQRLGKLYCSNLPTFPGVHCSAFYNITIDKFNFCLKLGVTLCQLMMQFVMPVSFFIVATFYDKKRERQRSIYVRINTGKVSVLIYNYLKKGYMSNQHLMLYFSWYYSYYKN